MRRLLLLLYMFSALQAKSQQNRFAFFQAAANEPFYIRMGEQTFSSTSFGYLVIPKLRDSTYKLYIGLPRNKSSEQLFTIPISGSDRGFELKKSSDGTIRLFDWQKMIFIDPAVRQEKSAETPTQVRTDNYSKLMAGVVNDPAVATTQVALSPVADTSVAVAVSSKNVNERNELSIDTSTAIVKPVEKPNAFLRLDTVKPVKQNDSPALNIPANSSPSIPAAVIVHKAPDTVKPGKDSLEVTRLEDKDSVQSTTGIMEPAPKAEQAGGIITISDRSTDGYRELVYLDRNSISTDTIDIRIAIEQGDSATKPVDTALYRVKKLDSTSSETALQIINSDCTKFATDAEVDKLRVQILNANSNDSKVAEAKKIFRTRCFSTKQIRGLSELFTSDDGRYKFFDASYPFISDSANFKTLVNLLEDPFYINRFKTLARIQE